MSELFKLEKEEFSKKYNEWWWIYSIQFEFIFNKKIITKITITDHPWQKKGREKITKELILELLTEMNGKTLEPMEYDGFREPYEWEVFHHDSLTHCSFDLKMELITIYELEIAIE